MRKPASEYMNQSLQMVSGPKSFDLLDLGSFMWQAFAIKIMFSKSTSSLCIWSWDYNFKDLNMFICVKLINKNNPKWQLSKREYWGANYLEASEITEIFFHIASLEKYENLINVFATFFA